MDFVLNKTLDSKKKKTIFDLKNKKCETYKNTGVLVDPASMHILVLKIKPCKSKCFVFVTLDCGPLIITGKIEIIF